jgi:hypothetical protein
MRLASLAEAEAAGESFWTDTVPLVARQRLVQAWKDSVGSNHYAESEAGLHVQNAVRRSVGTAENSVEAGLLSESVETVLTYVEAVPYGLSMTVRSYSRSVTTRLWPVRVAEIFNSHRVAFRFIQGEIVPLSSDELHVEVVEPTLRLLHGRRDLDKAHEAYLKALKEISNGDAPDAITDAGTALQETLTALGCQGNQLGDLLKDAKRRGILGAHDQKLIAGIESVGAWAAAERSQSGDSHKSSDAELADAWLMVHVVGALIVRLADPKPRHGQGASTSS